MPRCLREVILSLKKNRCPGQCIIVRDIPTHHYFPTKTPLVQVIWLSGKGQKCPGLFARIAVYCNKPSKISFLNLHNT